MSSGTLYFETVGYQWPDEELEVSVEDNSGTTLYSFSGVTEEWLYEPTTVNLSANTLYNFNINLNAGSFDGDFLVRNITFTGVDANSISITKSDGWTQN